MKPREQRWRVVIIDDNPDDRAELRRLLLQGSPRQYEFVEVETGAAGVRVLLAAPHGPPDCAILDYHLPDIDAPEVLAELRGPLGDGVCPVVVVTGSQGQAVGRAVLRAGAQDFIGKAWMTAESLTRALENATERWAMAQELRATDARLRLALSASKTGIWTWDLRTDAVTWTRECYEIHGVADGAFDGTWAGFLRLVHPDDRDRVEATARSAVEAHDVYHLEFRVVRPGAEALWVQHRGSASDAGGRPARMLGAITDVNERKRAEEVLELRERELEALRRKADESLRAALGQAQQAVRSRDELVSLVSHDLRNPLGSLVMGISLLEDEATDGGRDVLKRMSRQAQRMNEMIHELLDVAQLHAGRPLALERSDTDLVALTRALAEEQQHAAPKHRIEVRAGTGSLVGSWDPRRIQRVLNNLLSNAIKYSPGGGTVRVDLERVVEGGATWASLRITDAGIGIPASDLARIFQWYSRGENALRTSIRGIGIGLAGVRDIVEQHGGSIAVESEEGQGSTFTVRLPTRPPPAAAG